MKALSFLLSTMIFFAVFLITYAIHITYFKVEVILYSVLMDGLIAIFLTSIMLYFAFHIFTTSEKIMVLNKKESFEQVFTQEYLAEHRLVDVRLTEQLYSGTINIKNGCVLITTKGKKLAEFSRYFRTNWLPRYRLNAGKYSDDLTDPFRESKEIHDYTCQ